VIVIVKVTPTPAEAATPTPTPSPGPTPKPAKESKSKSWFSSLFKPHGKKPSPSPSATATPHKHRIKTEEEEASPTPGVTIESTPTPESTPAATPAEEATPAPAHNPGTMSSQVPFVPAPTPSEPVVETKSPAEIEADEESHFQAAKAKAMQDADILDLQSKADSATGDDLQPAEKRYYRALYDKMRDIDPSIKDRIDRTEAATMRRVEAEGSQ
jgi:hypothetical protein